MIIIAVVKEILTMIITKDDNTDKNEKQRIKNNYNANVNKESNINS